MVITYILSCIRIGTKPCKYFQLNSPWFDQRQGIFSKIAIDHSIPSEWLLMQRYDEDDFIPSAWPVFIKPEWGQNAAGIRRADNVEQLARTRRQNRGGRVRCLIQEGACESREFEVFAIRHDQDPDAYAVFSITEAINTEPNPINSIYNQNTRYADITERFNHQQRQAIWQMINRVGRFNISRTSMRADSEADLANGRFHIIEINLFLPMPIDLLDPRYRWRQIFAMVRRYMMALAKVTRSRDKALPEKPVFTKIMMYNRKNKLINLIRARI